MKRKAWRTVVIVLVALGAVGIGASMYIDHTIRAYYFR